MVIYATVSEKQTIPETQYPNSHAVETEKGSIAYSLIGKANPDKHPVIWVSGAEQGRINPYDVANLLADEGGRQVLIYDQPAYRPDVPAKDKTDPQKAIDFMAESVLAAADDAGLIGEGKVVDAVGHSMGSLVLERIKQLAEERGIDSFDQSRGAKIVLAAPTGSNSGENAIKLGGRWVPYSVKSLIEGKILDPAGQKGKALRENTKADMPKFLGETKAMAAKKIDYSKFGEALVLVYPEDRMFPENGPARRYRARRAVKQPLDRGFINHAIRKEYPLSFATPIGPERVAHKGLKRWLTKAAIKSGRRREYVRSYRGAGHNDPTDNPARTARSILDYLDS